ncbi:hypothetical protein Acr_00g0096650 [Actinidia rufa]|uniref:KIB1-4 beta-propeller domain-containing protein n=1 Tax=Actinidia rufa TaxID=165716 RepID=A0A7J0DZ12_9ERIC|nr:hypothetical protein Acr_00g0096650 [Actinidia rufa]
MDSSYRDWAWLPPNLLASIEEKLDKTMTITLLNPFTNGVITLPALNDPLGEFEYRIDNYPDYFVVKGILSLDPLLSPNNYEVVVIYGGMGRLASLTSGNNSWNFINLGQDYVFVDIIYHKGQVFAVDSWSKLVRIEVDKGATNYRVMTGRSNRCAQVAYLVESQEGDLLMVQRFWKKRKTFEFKEHLYILNLKRDLNGGVAANAKRLIKLDVHIPLEGDPHLPFDHSVLGLGSTGHPKDPLLRIGQCPDSCCWSCSWQSPRSRPVSRSQCGSDRQHESIGCLGV